MVQITTCAIWTSFGPNSQKLHIITISWHCNSTNLLMTEELPQGKTSHSHVRQHSKNFRGRSTSHVCFQSMFPAPARTSPILGWLCQTNSFLVQLGLPQCTSTVIIVPFSCVSTKTVSLLHARQNWKRSSNCDKNTIYFGSLRTSFFCSGLPKSQDK